LVIQWGFIRFCWTWWTESFKNQVMLHGWFLSRKYLSARHKKCFAWILLGTLPTFWKGILKNLFVKLNVDSVIFTSLYLHFLCVALWFFRLKN
jgi:hypothetical protein